jgi:hypothetical protein
MEAFICSHCDAGFKIKHAQNLDYYVVTFCPFCGGDIEEEEEEDQDDYE